MDTHEIEVPLKGTELVGSEVFGQDLFSKQSDIEYPESSA